MKISNKIKKIIISKTMQGNYRWKIILDGDAITSAGQHSDKRLVKRRAAVFAIKYLDEKLNDI